MLNCAQASRLVSDALDQPLTWKQRLALRLHLALCGACRRFAAQMRWLGVAGRKLSDHAGHDVASEALSMQARERIAAALRDDSPTQ